MNHRLLILIITGLVLVGLSVLIATHEKSNIDIPVVPEPSESALRFIPNAGQWDNIIKYVVNMSGGYLMLESNQLTYSFYELPEHKHGNERVNSFYADKIKQFQKKQDDIVKGHVLKIGFLGANENPHIVPAIKHDEYHNYFLGNDPSRWAGGVSLYGLLTYENLYPGVDLRIYGSGDNIKYDLIVAPGNDPAKIRLGYEGADRIFLKDGSLHVHTSIRNIVEEPPVVFQEIEGNTVQVPCEYVLNDNVLSYSFPQGYNEAYELTIDPTLVFSTYTGSTGDNWGFTATYDINGNLYAGGIIWAPNTGNPTSYPVTPGAIQTSYAGGGREAVISKFNATGTLMLYSTYLGGSALDQPHSLIANDNGELYVYGRTSSTNFPVTASGFDVTHNGGFDIFVSKFSNDGRVLRGSTFLGGSGDDGENGFDVTKGNSHDLQANYGDDSRGEIILDPSGNVYVAACTKSSNFPATPNSIQPNFAGGGQDGVVVKLSSDLTSRFWGAYIGGSGLDAAYGLKLDDQLNIYVTGGTTSGNYPTTPGALHSSPRGGTDGFITKINNNGTVRLASTYIGTSQYDQTYLLELDDEFNVYVTGQSDGNYPVVGQVYQSAGANQFITKLDNNLSGIIYSTTFGTANASAPNISPTAFLVDRCDNVYVTGWGGPPNSRGTTNGLPTTSDAINRNTDGSDFYIIVLDRDARNLLYATFMGGISSTAREHVDGGTSRFDREGIIYHAVCAGCGGQSTFPTTPGVVSNTNNSPNCNLAAFKIDLQLAGVEARFQPLDQSGQPLNFTGCAPLFVDFDNLSNGDPSSNYFWDYGDGTPSGVGFEPTHQFQNPGTYTVRLILEDSTSCNIYDTTYRQITVFAPPVADAGPDAIICSGDSASLTASGGGTGGQYVWSPPTGLSSTNGASVSAFPANDMSYVVTVTDANGCEAKDTVSITIDQTLNIQARPDTVVCDGVSVQLYASTNGVGVVWSPDNSLTDPNILTPVASPDTTTTYVITATSMRGCEQKDSVRVEVYEVYTLEDTFLCIGDTLLLATTNGVSFNWSPSFRMDNPNASSPRVWPDVTTTYTVDATSVDGCMSQKDVEVVVRPLPVAEVGPGDTICIGNSTQLQASGGITYRWDPAFWLTDPFGPDPIANPPQTTTYTVTAIDSWGCEDDATVTILVNPLPDVVAGPDSAVICEGSILQLSSTGALTYVWNNDPTLSDLIIPNPDATPTTLTQYVVTGTDENGCQNADTISVDVTPQPEVRIEAENFICVGGLLELTAVGGQRVVWNTGDTTRTISVLPNGPTLYVVTAIDGDCPGQPDSLVADQFFGYPEASFTYDPQQGFAPEEVQFTNTSVGAFRYEWYFANDGRRPDTDENPTHVFPRKDTYTVMLIAFSETGCPDTAYGDITLENVALFVPNAFTPNGDAVNGYFVAKHYGIRTLNVRIYSRWGMKIYESDDPEFQWDGIYKGAPVPEGVYVWVISGFAENDIEYLRKGTVTVIR